MVKALQAVVIPRLRERGFKGSFPHFRRSGAERIDLLTFQFDKWGGGFVVEIAKCPVAGVTTHWGEQVPSDRVRAWDVHPAERHRLQPGPGSSPSDWFRYDRTSLIGDVFEQTAQDVLPFLDKAEKWYATRDSP